MLKIALTKEIWVNLSQHIVVVIMSPSSIGVSNFSLLLNKCNMTIFSRYIDSDNNWFLIVDSLYNVSNGCTCFNSTPLLYPWYLFWGEKILIAYMLLYCCYALLKTSNMSTEKLDCAWKKIIKILREKYHQYV